MELVAIIISILTLLGLLIQIHLSWREMRADHERRKKQATLEYVNSIRAIYRSIAGKLDQQFGRDNVINIDDIDEEVKCDIQELLSVIEHLAVGGNTGVYDLQILERMSGAYFVRIHDKLSPYIRHRQTITRSTRTFCEFEAMVEDIKNIRGGLKRISRGKVKYS